MVLELVKNGDQNERSDLGTSDCRSNEDATFASLDLEGDLLRDCETSDSHSASSRCMGRSTQLSPLGAQRACEVSASRDRRACRALDLPPRLILRAAFPERARARMRHYLKERAV